MKVEFSRQSLRKYSNIKCLQTLSSGSRDVPYGQTEMTKPIVTFRNFVNAPKIQTNNGKLEANTNKYFHNDLRLRRFSELFETPPLPPFGPN